MYYFIIISYHNNNYIVFCVRVNRTDFFFKTSLSDFYYLFYKIHTLCTSLQLKAKTH